MLADEELHSGWALKEELRMWYQSATPADAEERLSAWEEAVRHQGPAELRTLLPSCRTWRQEILNYFTWPNTNGFVEGKNNRIKAIKRRGATATATGITCDSRSSPCQSTGVPVASAE